MQLLRIQMSDWISLFFPSLTFCTVLQNEEDYWLLSDADVSITDIWRADCILFVPCFIWFFIFISCYQWKLSSEDRILDSKIAVLDWNELNVIHEDYSIANVSTPRAQTPPSSTTELPSANTTGS